MTSLRSILVAALALVTIKAFWFIERDQYRRREEAQIRTRYGQMALALSSGDTNAAKTLFAPEFRGGADRSLGRLQTFARPLGPRSSVRLSATAARICPERIYHYGILPGGHTIDMVKIDGQWFFTGKVNVD